MAKTRNPIDFAIRKRNLICGVDMAKTRNPIDFAIRKRNSFWAGAWENPKSHRICNQKAKFLDENYRKDKVFKCTISMIY